jgi:GNAT superfamily N-acetyltransferase
VTDDERGLDIEPFDHSKHDYGEFCSGVTSIDNYIKRTAKKHQKHGMARIWVAVLPGSTKIIGYYALNAMSLDANDLPEKLRKHAPNHGNVPSVILSMIGVDSSAQGRGIGRVLMRDLQRRVAVVASQIGISVIMLEVLDDGNQEEICRRKAFYEKRGFQSFPSRPLCMFRAVNEP